MWMVGSWYTIFLQNKKYEKIQRKDWIKSTQQKPEFVFNGLLVGRIPEFHRANFVLRHCISLEKDNERYKKQYDQMLNYKE